jgi:hypothetical protein
VIFDSMPPLSPGEVARHHSNVIAFQPPPILTPCLMNTVDGGVLSQATNQHMTHNCIPAMKQLHSCPRSRARSTRSHSCTTTNPCKSRKKRR